MELHYRGPGAFPPAVGSDGTIYVGSGDDNLYAINPDGSPKWSFPTGSYVESSPAISGDGTIYVGSDSDDNNLYAINPDGPPKWNFTTGGDVTSSPAIGGDGTIYVGSDDNNLYAIEALPIVIGGEVAADSKLEILATWFGLALVLLLAVGGVALALRRGRIR